ncbi:hypothetical protein MCETE4_01908 [Acidimicrobiia bacterium]
MTPDEFVEAVSTEAFLDEIHSFLWSGSITNYGVLDEGWSCRDHAVVLATLAAVNGIGSHLCTGFNFFVLGPSTGSGSVGTGNDAVPGGPGHSWLELEGSATLDLSPTFESLSRLRRSFTSSGVMAQEWRTSLGNFDVVCVETAVDYNNAIAVASHQTDVGVAIYGVDRREKFHVDMLNPDFINSPLTRTIRGYGDLIYVKLAVHLSSVLSGESSARGETTQRKRWRAISRIPDSEANALLAELNHHGFRNDA